MFHCCWYPLIWLIPGNWNKFEFKSEPPSRITISQPFTYSNFAKNQNQDIHLITKHSHSTTNSEYILDSWKFELNNENNLKFNNSCTSIVSYILFFNYIFFHFVSLVMGNGKGMAGKNANSREKSKVKMRHSRLLQHMTY